MRIAIRADASLAIGSGHVMRCLTLADALRQRGAEVVFLTRAFPHGGASMIEPRGYRVLPLSVEPRYEASWLGASEAADQRMTASALASLGGVTWLVVDQYALGSGWEGAMRAHAGAIFAIDDLADRQHDCDLALDTTWLPTAERGRYAQLVPPHAHVLEGPRYALLRPEFARAPRRVRERIRRVLVFFGGADVPNLTARALDALDAPRFAGITVDVVVGAANPHREAVAARASGRVRVHIDTAAMASLMAEADCGIGAGGTTSWERLWLGLPSLLVAVADNQRTITRSLELAGVAHDFGWHAGVMAEHIAAQLSILCEEPRRVCAMSRAALALMGDGPIGTDQVVAVMLAHAGAGLRTA